jgi:hypothetical protein
MWKGVITCKRVKYKKEDVRYCFNISVHLLITCKFFCSWNFFYFHDNSVNPCGLWQITCLNNYSSDAICEESKKLTVGGSGIREGNKINQFGIYRVNMLKVNIKSLNYAKQSVFWLIIYSVIDYWNVTFVFGLFHLHWPVDVETLDSPPTKLHSNCVCSQIWLHAHRTRTAHWTCTLYGRV